MNIPRPEYPRPQLVRDNWMNLNGTWEFEFDFGKSGKERGMLFKDKYNLQIQVPFCPESVLSGVNYKDFINAAWYRRKFSIPTDWLNRRTLINFEAVDYFCEVWINEQYVGQHKGGYVPFSIDISKYLKTGDNIVAVYVEDDSRCGLQPSGKQSKKYHSQGCDYTRVTGIWQTVWLENVPLTYIDSYKIITDRHNSTAHITVSFLGDRVEKSICASAKYDGRVVGTVCAKAAGSYVDLCMALSEVHLWQPLDPKLYELEICSTADNHTDVVNSYFGVRDLVLTNNCMLINGTPVFQRLVLDQGYYMDGIYTAPDDAALKKDIDISIAMGFNGARLHQKVFERRFLYHADRLGYLVWGEYGNWGLNHTKAEALESFLPEWMESIRRDFNSPALIGWCPFNETWDISGCKQDDEVLRVTYLVTKNLDHTRPVIDTSGNFHVMTDIYDVHDYTQDPEEFAKHYETMQNAYEPFPERQQYSGQPYFVSEYGGIKWTEKESEDGWGYGTPVQSKQEFFDRYIGLANVLITNPQIFALCYTQLYDVEQEINGLYYYDRTPKFSESEMKALADVMAQKAAIEQAEII